jgi:stage III sporulation protein AF
MIVKLRLWTQNILIAVIISIIIEMILPDSGGSKKYVKVISGLYILYMIINPILNLGFNDESFELKNIINEVTVETFSETDVANTYVLSLENALKENIENLGYSVEYVQFTITSDYSEIVKIEIKMKAGTTYDSNKIIDLISQNYSIDSKNIIIN